MTGGEPPRRLIHSHSAALPPAGDDRVGRFLKEVADVPQRAAQVQCLRVIPARPARHAGELPCFPPSVPPGGRYFSGTTAPGPQGAAVDPPAAGADTGAEE